MTLESLRELLTNAWLIPKVLTEENIPFTIRDPQKQFVPNNPNKTAS